MSTLWNEMLGAQVQFYDVDGIRTRVIHAGNGPAVLFLHGSGGHAEAFARNIVPLAERYHVIAMDYLGSGLTDYPAEGPTLADRIKHIVGLLDAMGIQRAVLAGESFGGTQAFAVARAHPTRVAALIAIVGGAFQVDDDPQAAAQWESSMHRMVDRQRAFLADPTRENVRQRLRWLFHRPDEVITEELVDVRWRFYQREPVRRAVRDMAEMIAYDIEARRVGPPASRSDALRPMSVSELQSVRHPTLFVWTDHNPSTPARTARIAADHVPGAQFELMQNCGHWPQWEDPETFNTIIERFLDTTLGIHGAQAV